MQRSIDRILTTHTGSLPRPADLLELLNARDARQPFDPVAFDARARSAVDEVVRRQVATGIDIVSDGEMGKIGYSTYVKDRLTGFEGPPSAPLTLPELVDFPEYAGRLFADPTIRDMRRPSCVGPVAYKGKAALEAELARLRSAVEIARPIDTFVTAASPGVIAMFLDNAYYANGDAYLHALASAMREEYEAIHQAGFVLQLDCPDLAITHGLEPRIAALNHAVSNIPPNRMRLHVCWGNYEGPHHKDAPLASLIAPLLRARPAGLSITAANARHEHEWKVFEKTKLPDGKVLIPGVIDSTTNIIEHPETVCERICRFANVVGPENVIAGTDCGFGTFAGYALVDSKIAWAKLQSLVEGARLATAALFSTRGAKR